MRKFLALLVTVIAVVGVAPAAPAVAGTSACPVEMWGDNHAYVGTAAERMCWPVAKGTTVVLEAPKGIWRLRNVIRKTVDPRLTGISFVTDLGVQCENFPGAYCLTVRKINDPSAFAETGNVAHFNFPDWENHNHGEIMFNNAAVQGMTLDYKKWIATHELVHMLGMDHHAEVGVIGNISYPEISEVEWAALEGWYNS